MKIVLVAPPSSFSEQLKKAFIKNGSELIYVNDREIKILPILKNNLFSWWLIRKLPKLKRINNELFGRDLVNICRQEKPDLLFVNKGMIIKPETLKEIKLMGIKTVNWFMEGVYYQGLYMNWFSKNFIYYDYFFHCDTYLVEKFVNSGTTKIIYIPAAVDPDFFKLQKLTRVDIEKYSCDICFVGARYPQREKLLNIVKDFNLKIYGWPGWKKSSLASFYNGPLNINEMVKLYNCAKICININLEPIINGVNLKSFEIPAAGGFQLSDYRKDIDGLFEKGKEIEIFKHEDELRSKIKFYLDNEDLRKNIALAGQSRVLKDHTLEQRITQILKIISIDYSHPFC